RVNEVKTLLEGAEQALKVKEEEIQAVKIDRVSSYLDGFDFAIAQAKVIYPSVDHQLLEQDDPFKFIRDGKLVDQECPAYAVSPKAHSSGEVKTDGEQSDAT
ncbi:hypothetical protein A2U01_0071050, partial [Trifolium medium]|nr:hypothetical protein [Trifolium medium]